MTERNNGNENDDPSNNRLFELYKAKANDFQKVFIALLAFTLIFLFVIFSPYFSILEKNNNINGQIGDLQQKITQHQNNIYYYQIAENGTETLQKVLQHSPEEVGNEALGLLLIKISHQSNAFSNEAYNSILVDYIKHRAKMPNLYKTLVKTSINLKKVLNNNSSVPLANQTKFQCDKFAVYPNAHVGCNLINKIQSLANSYVQAMNQQYHTNNISLTYPYCSNKFTTASIDDLVWSKWADCNLNNKIQSLANSYVQILKQKVVTPIYHIANVSPLLNNPASLEKRFQIFDESNKINLRFFESLKLNPQPFAPLSLTAGNVSKMYSSILKPIRIVLKNQISLQGNELKDLKNKVLQLSANKTRLINDKVGIETRLNETQFPFGKLPLNLDQSVAAFPIALAIGFVVCASLQRSTIRLRKEFHRWYKEKYPQWNNFTDQKVALIAPLWIDPISSKVNQIAKFIILVIPFFVFILAIYLISNYLFLGRGNQYIASYFTSDNIGIYSGLYVLGMTLFIYGCWSMIIELRSYKCMNENP